MTAARPMPTCVSAVAKPEVSDLPARVRVARDRAEQTEAVCRVSDDMIARTWQANLFCIMQPKADGGFKHGFDVFAASSLFSRCRRRLFALPVHCGNCCNRLRRMHPDTASSQSRLPITAITRKLLKTFARREQARYKEVFRLSLHRRGSPRRDAA